MYRMSLFCCYAKQDTNKPDVADELIKEAQDHPLLEVEAEVTDVKVEVTVDDEVKTEVDNIPIGENELSSDTEEEYGVKSEYKPIVYDSVTNTMEEFIEPQSEK